MKRLFALLFIVCSPVLAGPDEASQAVARWNQAWAQINNYYCGCHSHIVKGSSVEDRTWRVWFRKPLVMRAEIAQGSRSFDGGSVAVYTGGDKVTGHQGGLLSSFTLTLPLDDSRATTIRGSRITELQFGYNLDVLHRYAELQVPMAITSGTAEGHAATILTCSTDQPAFISNNHDVCREIISFDAVENVPLEWHRFDTAGTEIATVSYYDVHINIDMPDTVFQVHSRVQPP